MEANNFIKKNFSSLSLLKSVHHTPLSPFPRFGRHLLQMHGKELGVSFEANFDLSYFTMKMCHAVWCLKG